MKYWLLKSEPDAWSWDNQVGEGTSMWDGVRNYQARNNLKEMKKNDLCFFYHSVTEKSIVGIVKVVKEYYPDPTDKTGRFVVVDVKATKKLKNPVSLDQIKENNKLKNIALVKQSRLSVMPLKKTEWDVIIKMSNKPEKK
jgi:predicted RNA-binding protein with PUA-like domain